MTDWATQFANDVIRYASTLPPDEAREIIIVLRAVQMLRIAAQIISDTAADATDLCVSMDCQNAADELHSTFLPSSNENVLP